MARTLLVAEPDPLQRQLIDMLVAEDRYEVVFVSSGREALSFLREQTPSIALLSLELPDVTGAEICEKMKRVTRLADVPVVLVTATGHGRGIDATTRELARFVGADLLLQKPLGDKNLRDRLQSLLEAGTVPQRPKRSAGLTTEALEETIGEIKSDARLAALERENARLQQRIEALEDELDGLRGADAGADGSEAALDDEGRTPEQRIAALERRNELLLAELVKCKESRKRGGLFGRRD